MGYGGAGLRLGDKASPGQSNADALSRNPVRGGVVLAVQAEIAEGDQPPKESMASEVKELQKDDTECKAMLAYLEMECYQRKECWQEK